MIKIYTRLYALWMWVVKKKTAEEVTIVLCSMKKSQIINIKLRFQFIKILSSLLDVLQLFWCCRVCVCVCVGWFCNILNCLFTSLSKSIDIPQCVFYVWTCCFLWRGKNEEKIEKLNKIFHWAIRSTYEIILQR